MSVQNNKMDNYLIGRGLVKVSRGSVNRDDIPLGDGLGTTKTNWIRKETVSFAIDLPISVMNRDFINKIRN